MTLEEDLAIGFANLKGRRDKDYLATARALKRLKDHPKYNTNAKLAETFQVSREIIREFLSLLELPGEVQSSIEAGALKLEHGRRLRQLARKRPDLVMDAAQAMRDLSAHEARHVVDYALKHPELGISEAKEQVLSSKPEVRKEFHVVAILPEREYRDLSQRAQRRKMAVSDLVTSLVVDWLSKERSRGSRNNG